MSKKLLNENCFYKEHEVIAFKKVAEEWGGFSNFSREYPIVINDVLFDCSERFFQILRYGEYPDFQKEFMEVKSAFWAKKLKHKHKEKIRRDWDFISLDVMKYVLNEKYKQNKSFRLLLDLVPKNKYIVEDSTKLNGDSAIYWGAKFNKDKNVYEGINNMGKLLMLLKNNGKLNYNLPNDLKIFGSKITYSV